MYDPTGRHCPFSFNSLRACTLNLLNSITLMDGQYREYTIRPDLRGI